MALPEPVMTDFRCGYCRASPGRPCASNTVPFHAPRIDAYLRAHRLWKLDAVNAAHPGLGRTDHLQRFLNRRRS